MSVQPESDQKYLVYSDQEGQDAAPPSWNWGVLAIGIILTFVLSPIFVIIPLCCCLSYAEARTRASYNLGAAIGIATWGGIFFVLAIMIPTTLTTLCVKTIETAVLASVVSSYSGNADVAAAITNNATMLAQIDAQITPMCSMFLGYALYGFLGLGALLVLISLCMCHRSRKMLRRVGH
ncbi:UNVERIFIED_CONTAM: hypothetical protein HDU68_002197 [Siphonaria sp. JEL0065]|nr:hypothetical protein HDU68_002197 [Siphonaria sp. JEL0065]